MDTRILYRFHLHVIDIPSPEISKTGSHSKNQSITESKSSIHMSSVVWCDSHVCWCDSSYGDNCPVLFDDSFYTGCQGNYEESVQASPNIYSIL